MRPAPATFAAEDAPVRRNVKVLFAAQALLGAQMPVHFVLGALAGQVLSPIACLATLPVSLTVFGSMAAAPVLGALMQRYGRRPGFILGAAGGGTGAALCVAGLLTGSFGLFLAGSALTGLYMSAQGFYRFAAADGTSVAFRPKAISYVMAAGLISAVIGPQMVKLWADALAPVPFAGAYAAEPRSSPSCTARARRRRPPTRRRRGRGGSFCATRRSRSRWCARWCPTRS
jgi:MFS family permease